MGMRVMFCCGNNVVMVVLSMMLVVITIILREGLAQDTSCVSQLLPCLSYLNGTRDPPNSCCDPLKSVIDSNPECLCSMISIKGTNEAEKAGINVTEAQELPGRCGLRLNPVISSYERFELTSEFC